MHEILHADICGCVYKQIDVPDDQGYGQGWKRISNCIWHSLSKVKS